LNCPYPLTAPLATQIHTSVASSLHNLRHQEDGPSSSYLDSLLLHSPLPSFAETLEAWEILSSYVPTKIRCLGISNISFSTLKRLYEEVDVKPSFVHVRFYPETRYENEMRSFCKEKGIAFQAYRVLKGNRQLLESEVIGKVSEEVGISKECTLLIAVSGLGVSVLNGPKSVLHMKEDVKGWRKWGVWMKGEGNKGRWEKYMAMLELEMENGVLNSITAKTYLFNFMETFLRPRSKFSKVQAGVFAPLIVTCRTFQLTVLQWICVVRLGIAGLDCRMKSFGRMREGGGLMEELERLCGQRGEYIAME
jgi:hypothetical protein